MDSISIKVFYGLNVSSWQVDEDVRNNIYDRHKIHYSVSYINREIRRLAAMGYAQYRWVVRYNHNGKLIGRYKKWQRKGELPKGKG